MAVDSQVTDFTAVGDAVNAAARLASAAGGGEVLISEATLAAATLNPGELQRRQLSLRGREAPLTFARPDTRT